MVLDAVVDRISDNSMRLTERQAFLRKVVRHVGRIREVTFKDLAGVIAIDSHSRDHAGIDIEGEVQGIQGIKDAFLIFLHVLVIGQRQTLHDGQKTDEVSIDTAGFAANELTHVRILLLRHDRAARGVSVIKLNELEFAGGPVNEFFRQTREMHRTDRCEGEKLEKVVTIRDRIEAVSIDGGEVKVIRFFLGMCRVRGPCQRTGADRRHVTHIVAVFETLEVTLEHRKVREHVMSEEDRLRALHVGVARQDDILIFLGSSEEGF